MVDFPAFEALCVSKVDLVVKVSWCFPTNVLFFNFFLWSKAMMLK